MGDACAVRPDVERCGEVNVRVPPEVEDEALLRHSVELVETHACAEHAEKLMALVSR